MTRFNDPGYLVAFKESGVFPKIHDAIFEMIVNHDPERVGLDLCCSSGLLGQRLLEQGFKVVGVDKDRKVMELAREYGVAIPFYIQPLTNFHSADHVLQIIANNELKAIYARRCLPELFGHDLELGKWFFQKAKETGISRVFLQGRVPVQNAKNPLASIDHEVKMLEDIYTLRKLSGQVAYLGV